MAETSDFTGWVPAGTPHYSGFQNPRMTFLAPAPLYGAYDEGSSLVALVAFFILAYATNPGQFHDLSTMDPMVTVGPLPNAPIQENAVSQYTGSGMWIGPGVVFYAC